MGSVTKPSTLLKVTLLHWSFSPFLKLYEWYQIAQNITFLSPSTVAFS